MEFDFDREYPIIPQICDSVCSSVVSGEMSAGQKLLSVREFALCAGVNPNTVQRAYEQLEHLGIIYSVRSSGWFVSDNSSAARERFDAVVGKRTEMFVLNLKKLGLSADRIIELVKEKTL